MRRRFLRSLLLPGVCSIALAAQTSTLDARKPPEESSAVHKLFIEDQKDATTINNEASNAEYLQHVKMRESSLRAMLSANQIISGNDFLEAAVIFQHGDNASDCLFAHILAMEAMAKGTASAMWIAAATLDRYLQYTKQPQVFGTQYANDPSHPINVTGAPFPYGKTLQPYDDGFLSDSLRTDFCVPTLTQQKQNVAMFNAGKWPRATMHPPCH